MKRNAILHLADLHLGAPVFSGLRNAFPDIAERLQTARDRLLGRLADWILDPDCPVGLLLLAGDLFDHHAPRPELEDQAIQDLSRIIAAGVKVVTVPGNHDELAYPNSVYRRRSWPGVLVQNREPRPILELEAGSLFTQKLVIVSASFHRGLNQPGEVLDPPEVPADAMGILLLHATVADDGFLPEFLAEAESVFRTFLRTNAARGYSYTALGHIHRRSTWTVNRMLACYPGPPLGTSPSELGSGSFVLLRQTNAGRFTSGQAGLMVESITPPGLLPCRWLPLEENVTPGDRPAEIVERIKARLPSDNDYIGALTLTGTVKSRTFAEDCQALFIQAGLPIIVAETRTRQLPPLDLDLLAKETSLVGEWIRLWQQWQEQEQPDPAFAEQVLWEALACFGQPDKSEEPS
ncbi:MAG: DNA repair exonuclease [Thermoguttaceae bacterium]|nr:DNA repair exonuclease [Thermoguttaceae bacterium]MDW8078552.1 DNA repair exonuclease [Thermoguttaceae bacterium]